MLKPFLRDRSGNFAIIGSLIFLPMVLAVGFGIDASRYYSARANLQDAADTTALALAASPLQDSGLLRDEAEIFAAANYSVDTVEDAKITAFQANSEQIDLSMSGLVHTTFMRLANVDTMPLAVSSLAMRAPVRKVELAMVLDNTWSMSESSGGVSKIDTLKQAALELVKTLLTPGSDDVRIGLVPYADYVNVGLKYRNASWLNVASDYSVAASPRVCQTRTTKSVCVSKTPTYSCTKTTDGVEEPATCGGSCTYKDETVAPYESCSGGGNPTEYKWYGCVGSRVAGTSYLNDGSPSIRYPGFVETSQKCLTPIVTLTDDKAVLDAALKGMIINRGSYKPYTYIPAGLIWGQNVLSPSEPLAEADPYDGSNLAPRKVMILMTDGDNTRKLTKDTKTGVGTHAAFDSNAAKAKTQFDETNSNSLAICTFAKSNKIELYTVAFMVDNAEAKTLLQRCASDEAHYFDAGNRDKLLSAFSGIARSINQVRLAR